MEKELQEIAQAIEKMYASVPPPPRGLAGGRQRLLQAAARQRTRSTARQRFALRFAAALAALLLATLAVGSGVAWAASESLPGQLLYPLKLEMENAQLSFAQTAETQVELALRFADERVAEIQSLAGSSAVSAETAERLEQHLQYALRRAAEAPPEETARLLARIAERTQAQVRTLERVRESTGAGAMAQVEHAWRICNEGNQAAVAGLADPQTFRWRYQQRQGQPEETPIPSATPPATEGQQTPEPARTPGGPHRTPRAGQGDTQTPTPGSGQGMPGSGGTTPSPSEQQPTPGGEQPPSGEGQGEPGGGSSGGGSGGGQGGK